MSKVQADLSIGLRNVMIREYDSVDLTVVWDTIKDDLPPMVDKLEKSKGEEARQAVRLVGEYLKAHAGRMRYREFRDAAVPVGSGTVESACKNLVGSRLKRGGMRWKPERAEAVLSLRCALLGDEWKQAWDTQRRAA